LQGKLLEKYLEDLNSRRVFVKYIPKVLRANDRLELFFSQFGEIDYGYVVKDHYSKEAKDFGYITFKE
jgi:RNA recognition motif-containing protein